MTRPVDQLQTDINAGLADLAGDRRMAIIRRFMPVDRAPPEDRR